MVLRVTTSGTTSDYEWLQVVLWVTTSNYKWLRVVLRVTTNDYEWYYEWLQMTTNDYEWCYEWLHIIIFCFPGSFQLTSPQWSSICDHPQETTQPLKTTYIWSLVFSRFFDGYFAVFRQLFCISRLTFHVWWRFLAVVDVSGLITDVFWRLPFFKTTKNSCLVD